MVDKLKWLTCFAVVLAAVVVILGAYTRLVDAGLGCPDWPGCYGFISVPETTEKLNLAAARFPDAPVEIEKAWAEMVHRYFASTLGLIILIMAIMSWRLAKLPEHKNLPVKLPLLLLVLVILQGAFGAWTVTLKLWPQVVTAHLLGGFATLSLLFLLVLRQNESQGLWAGVKLPKHLKTLAKVSLVVLVLQIALGGWVSSNYAALACSDFPTCQGELVPAMDLKSGFNFTQDIGPNYLGGNLDHLGRIAIHFSHRLGALITFLVITWLAIKIWRHNMILGALTGGVLFLQVGLGISNILFALPLVVATTHNAIGAGLLLVLVSVNCFVHRGGLNE